MLSHLNQLDKYGVDVKCTSQVLGYCSYMRKKVWLLFVSTGNQKLCDDIENSNGTELSLRYVNLSNSVCWI